MQHVAEIAVHQFLEKVASGEASFSEKTAKRVADDVKDAVKRQFSSDRKKDFTLRMSNVGRPSCQLWFEKNKPSIVILAAAKVGGIFANDNERASFIYNNIFITISFN